MKKIVGYGIVVGIVNTVLGMAVSYLFMIVPSVAADYDVTGIMRPWSDPIMSLFFIYPFLLGIILAWAWNKSRALFTGSISQRGFKFGLSIWIISAIPGMFVTYSSFPLSIVTVISWLVSGFVTAVAAGIILAKLNK